MATEFVFVDQSGSDTRGALQQSRKRIRSQARLHTLSRWKTNRMQSIEIQLVNTPEDENVDPFKKKTETKSSNGSRSRSHASSSSSSNSSNPSSSRKTTPGARCEKSASMRSTPSIPWDVPPNGYEKARSSYNFDLNWLSAMAVNHVGRAPYDNAAPIPMLHITSVHDWLDLSESTFLEYVPTLYDTSPLIQDLVDAMMAKAQQALPPASHDLARDCKVMQLYGKALKSVQDALRSEDAVFTPETLCATHLIQLYELFDLGPPAVWLAHTKGMHHLIRMRGPQRFKTPLERSLLRTQFQHIFSQAFRANSDCFLELPEWQELMQDMLDDPNPAYPSVQVDLWRTIAALPRLLRQTTEFVLDESCLLDRHLLLAQIRNLKRHLVSWRSRYLKGPQDPPLSVLLSNSLLAVSLSIGIFVNRLLVALQPRAQDAVALERETQKFAGEVMTLRMGKIVTSGYFIGMVAKATAAQWREVAEGKKGLICEPCDVVKAHVWIKWNAMLGRTDGVYGSSWGRG